jgi:hypothetical protein
MPRPLLTAREEKRALGLAARLPDSHGELAALVEKVRARGLELIETDDRFREYLANRRVRLLHAEYGEQKGEDGEVMRLGRAHFFDYDRSMAVTVSADLRTGEVLSIEDRPGVRPIPSDEEIAEARELAAAHPGLTRAARRRDAALVAFPARAPMEDDPAVANRRLELHFWSGSVRPRRVGSVIVDLTARELLPFTEDQEG